MKLEMAFKIYKDPQRMRRKSSLSMSHYDIGWLKQLHAWGNEESREMGFIIPSFMIEDANADDWELVENGKKVNA